MQDLFYSGWVFTLIGVLMAAECLLLLYLYGRERIGIPPSQLLPNLASGFFLIMAIRAAVLDSHWTTISGWLLASLAAHLLEVLIRWQR